LRHCLVSLRGGGAFCFFKQEIFVDLLLRGGMLKAIVQRRKQDLNSVLRFVMTLRTKDWFFVVVLKVMLLFMNEINFFEKEINVDVQ
jgi:hypothetical protein